MKRKLVCIVSLSVAGVILGYLFFVGWLAGFLLSKYVSGQTTGKKGRIGSTIISFGKHKIHLHHWLISSGLIVIGLITNVGLLASIISYGVLSGSVFQGIYSYSDWHKILISRGHQEVEDTKIYNTEYLSKRS